MTLHPALANIDLVVFDKDGTLISFEAMWAPWARSLGARLEATTRRPVAGDVFAAIGFDPVANRVTRGGPLAVETMAAIEERVAAVLRRWCPSVPAARRALAGDMPADLRMAGDAGAGLAVGVQSGVADHAELEPLADLVLGSVADLLLSSTANPGG